jgi:uncharacterized SAM-binding protein YcdF (DUF218 family)
MMIYLHKILPLIFSPLIVTMLLVAYGIIKNKKRYSVAGLVLLYASSTFVIADFLFAKLEGQGLKIEAKDAPSADAIVVLSGMMMRVQGAGGSVAEWSDADRFFGGLDLYQAGKAPRLIFTGGLLPWEKTSQSEGAVLKAHAQRFGIPEASISVSGDAQNTEEEAVAVRAMLTDSKILLVTSAFHMLRAKHQFERQGFEVSAFPVDFKVRSNALTPMDFLPDPSALRLMDVMVREYMGRLYYQLNTWIRGSRT